MRRRSRIALRPRPAEPTVRWHMPRIGNAGTGVIGLVLIALVCYVVFGGRAPWAKSPFVLKAVFTANTELHIPSPVRLAGVDVGEVTSVTPLPGRRDAGLVTMHIDSGGLPIHKNATLLIRSRIFLEGNFYVALSPGTPGAPVLRSGATLPAASTSGPVQFDRILSALNSDGRTDLQALLRGFGGSLNDPADATDEAGQDPSVRDLTGAQALNENLRYAPGAFEKSSIVNEALLGERPHDLSGVVQGEAEVFRALSKSQSSLEGFVTHFEETTGALAARGRSLSATIAILPGLLQATDAADGQLDRSFAPTQAFAREILPGVHQLARTINVALPWVRQLTDLAGRPELGGLLADLTPAVENTASALTATKALTRSLGTLARCFTHTIIPTNNESIRDQFNPQGLQIYQDFFQSAVGIAGAAGNFDGNGRYVRSTVGGGSELVQTKSTPGNGPLYGNAVLAPLGTRPTLPTTAPPIDRTALCELQPVPNLNSAATGAGP